MSDDLDDLEAEEITAEELRHLCEIAAQFLGMDAVLDLLEEHAYGGTVH
jgi:hypothetical protein